MVKGSHLYNSPMKTTLAGLLIAISALIGSGIWIGRRSVEPRTTNLELQNRIYENGRVSAFREVAACTVVEAHKDLCFIPCASDEDCLQKNGQKDH